MGNGRYGNAHRRGATAAALVSSLILAVGAASACSEAGIDVGKGDRPAPTEGSGPTAPSTVAAGAAATPSTEAADPAMSLEVFYREVLGADEATVGCFTDAATAQGLATVADLERAEAQPDVAAALSAAYEACTNEG